MTEASIIIAAFNAEDSLERAVRSALLQEDADIEVLVVDDASTDGTLETAKSLACGDGRVKVIQHTVNLGPGAARNSGIRCSTGAWLVILDADDAMNQRRVREGIDYAVSRDANVIIGEYFEWCAESGEYLKRLRFNWPPHVPVPAHELIRRGMGAGQPIVERAFLSEHGVSYPCSVRLGEDLIFLLRLANNGAIIHVWPNATYDRFKRPESLTGNRAVTLQGAAKLMDRLELEDAARRPEVIEAIKWRRKVIRQALAANQFRRIYMESGVLRLLKDIVRNPQRSGDALLHVFRRRQRFSNSSR